MSPSSGLTCQQRMNESTHTLYMRLKCAFNENRCMDFSRSFGCLNPQGCRWSSAFTFRWWPGSLSPIGMPKIKNKNKNWTPKKNLNKTKSKTKQKQNLETSLSRLKRYMVSCFVQITQIVQVTSWKGSSKVTAVTILGYKRCEAAASKHL